MTQDNVSRAEVLEVLEGHRKHLADLRTQTPDYAGAAGILDAKIIVLDEVLTAIRALPASEAVYTRAEVQAWRDDAFEAAAMICERYAEGGGEAALDIRFLKSRPVPPASEAGEVAMMRAVITEANNSLYGSQGFFMSLSGEKPAHKHHLAEGIEELKTRSSKNWQGREMLREALTPSLETKQAYMGEFSIPFPMLDEDGGEVIAKVNVPWTTIKEIMAAVRARAALQEKPNE